MNNKLVTILGPTAVGKTKIAVNLANKFNGEIISADSRQVYRGMNIGTGKDLEDYQIDDKKVPYHLVDILEPSDEFNLFEFIVHFIESYKKITDKKNLPFLVGGTGLYIESIINRYELSESNFDPDRKAELEEKTIGQLQEALLSYNPELHNTTDLIEKNRIIRAILIEESKHNNNRIVQAPKLNNLIIGVKFEREIIKKRITERLKQRLHEGMIEEVKKLLDSGITHERLKLFGLEYKFLSLYIKGELNYNDMFQKLNSAIHQFAKRQMTWFRKMERNGIQINWIEGHEYEKAEKIISDKFFS